jgi:hypothetical protein
MGRVGDIARLRSVAALVCVSGVILMTASCNGEPPRTQQPAPVSSSPASDGSSCTPAEVARAADCAGLLRTVRQRKSAPIIVTLAVEFTPEGDLTSAAAVQRQRKAIADAQARLIAELPSAGARVTTRFATTPLIALVVDEAALRQLLASSRVRRIQADTPQPPTG